MEDGNEYEVEFEKNIPGGTIAGLKLSSGCRFWDVGQRAALYTTIINEDYGCPAKNFANFV